MNKLVTTCTQVLPRLVRLRDTPFYLGMDRNRFNSLMQISFLSLITPTFPSLFDDFRMASESLVSKKYELGINNGISDQNYHQGPDISSSGVKLVRRSPLHFWDQYIDPQKESIDSKSLRLRRATHCLTLEPDSFDDRYAIEQNINKQTNVGKAEYQVWPKENTVKTDLPV